MSDQEGDDDQVTKRFDLDEAGDHFHMMMGNCIAEWSHIEDYFFMVCHSVLQCPKQQAAVVYYKTPNFDARMTLADELVKIILPQHNSEKQKHEDLKVWEDAYKIVDKLKPVRNRIAHCQTGVQASALMSSDRGEEVPLESWFALYESNNQKLRGKPIPPPLLLTDLRSHLIAVNRARTTLHLFYYDVLPKHVQVPPPR